MSDDYFGYTPYQLPASIAQYDDYTASMGTVDYQPTDWNADATTIDLMWPWIQIDSDARATALADMWRRVHTLLDNTSRNLRRYTEALSDKWHSDASKVFMREIGASLSSLDEWKEVASTNATGLDVLASTIAWNQKNALRIWKEYCSAISNPGSVPGSAAVVKASGHYSSTEKEDDRKTRLVKKYTQDIKPYVKDLADTYLLVYFNYLTWGTTYKGPTNAAMATPPTIKGGGPGGSIPAPPVLPPPTFPKVNPPDPSALQNQLQNQLQNRLDQLGATGALTGDHALTLAGQAVLPPLPEFPTVTGPPGPPVMGTPISAVGLPTLPGFGRLGEAGGPMSGLDPAEAAARLGEGPGGLRPQLPGRPNLSGLRPPPGRGLPPGQRGTPPGQRPQVPGRGNPNLRGAKGRATGAGPNLDEEMPRSPRGPAQPRLGGRRGGGQSGHMGPEDERLGGRGTPPGGGRPGGSAERLSGRRTPGLPLEEQEAFNRQAQTRPTLEGRGGQKRPTGPVTEDGGHSPSLRGRTGGEPPFGPNARPPQQGRGRDQHDAYGDEWGADEDELWAVERPNPTVIDTPHLPPPTDAGPAIGRP